MQTTLQFTTDAQIDAQILAFLDGCDRPAHYETIAKAVKQSEFVIGGRLLCLAYQGKIWEQQHGSFCLMAKRDNPVRT